MVYKIRKETIYFLKNNLGSITKVKYYTDGCAYLYENCKKFINFCKHEENFGVCTKWFFLLPTIGKSACNEIRGRVKRSIALESLKRPVTNQILNLKQSEHCQNTIPKIHF